MLPSPKKPIRVLIADDHDMVRVGLRGVIEKFTDLSCVGDVGEGASIIPAIEATQPHVLLLDLGIPDVPDPAAAAREIKERYPDLKILVLTGYNDEELIRGLIDAGASGYILKDDTTKILAEAIYRVAEGHEHYSQKVAQKLADMSRRQQEPRRQGEKAHEREAGNSTGLTNREIEVIRGVGRGLSNPEIGAKLHISEYTVRTHITRINSKLGLGSSRPKLMTYAFEHGYLADTPDDESK